MLNLSALRKALSAVLSPPRLHTAILFTPSGELVAHASSTNSNLKDKLRVLVGLSSEIWYEISDEGIGMAESELGKIIVLPLRRRQDRQSARMSRSLSRSPSSIDSAATPEQRDPPFLIALNAMDEVEWAEMQIKAKGVVNHLADPLIEFGDRLCAQPPILRNIPRITHNFY